MQLIRPRGTRVFPLLFAACALSGCGIGVPAPPGSSGGAALTGRVHGGQQPVSGAAISLYAAGLTGPGAGAVNLLAGHSVTTDIHGNFSISGDYACPGPTAQVYLVASGGNPGLAAGTNNPALALMAALGDCGNLTSGTFIFINEVTTVASAWALSQFLAPGAVVGASATNAAGLRNAFLNAQSLANSSTGTAPGAALPAGAVIETAKLLTLADALAPCVNSAGGSQCTGLFTATTAPGSTPATTLDAALNVVLHPAANVSAIYDLASAAPPFQPGLAGAPNDWTLSITFGGCTPACGGLNQPAGLAIDSTGSVWVANYFGAVVSKFLPNGAPAAPQGFPGVGLRQSFGVAVDPYDNAWISNETSVTGANNSHLGSISKFNSAGVELSGYGYTGGGVYYPQGIASDPLGNLWVADYGDSSSSLLANDGTAISGSGGFGSASLPFTSAVAVDASRNAWFSAQQAAVRVSPAGVVSTFPCCVDPAGIAVDPSGNVWLGDYGGASIVELNSVGAVMARVESPNGTDGPEGVAVDGSGQVFAANFRGNSITQLSGSAAVLSPTGGFGLDAPLDEPLGIAVDASGNLWVSNLNGNTVTQFLGLASPVKTPLLGPPAKP